MQKPTSHLHCLNLSHRSAVPSFELSLPPERSQFQSLLKGTKCLSACRSDWCCPAEKTPLLQQCHWQPQREQGKGLHRGVSYSHVCATPHNTAPQIRAALSLTQGKNVCAIRQEQYNPPGKSPGPRELFQICTRGTETSLLQEEQNAAHLVVHPV